MRGALFTLLLVAAHHAAAHAPILPPIQGPLQTRGNLLIDATGEPVVLRGMHMPGLEVLDPAPDSRALQNVAAMTRASFAVIRIRWNMNTVRLPVSVRAWRRDGARYLDRVAAIVRLANDADLAVVLAAQEEGNGLPSPDTVAFWREWATRFRDNTRVIFSVFRQPSARNVPGAVAGRRTAADWRFWLTGGTAADGQRAAGMQEIVDAIRSTGARQLIAVSAFHDASGFQGLTAELQIRDSGVIYEVHPSFEFGWTAAQQEASFGFLTARVPVYLGEWGIALRDSGPACQNLPRDPQRVTEFLFETMFSFETRNTSWTAASFEPGSLLGDFVDYLPTLLDRSWTCGVPSTPQPGMGEVVILWMTGDPTGFGALRAELIANAAGGPSSPVAPGELLSIYAEQLGPMPDAFGGFGANGRLPTNLGGSEVMFDGVAAPLLYASPFQINVQVPYGLVAGTNTVMQAFFRGMPSNRLSVPVVEAAPEMFYDIATRSVVALNEDGSRNGSGDPAPVGTIVVFFASGGGQTSPPGVTGAPAPSPHPILTHPAAVTVEGRPAEVLFAGEVPGFVGLLQINARLPAVSTSASPRPLPVVLQVGSRTSRAPVLVWVR